MNTRLFTSACIVALGVSGPALAQDWAASVAGDFGNFDGHSLWDANGAVEVPLGWNDVSVQGGIGAAGADSLHEYNGGGDLVWNSSSLRVAGTVIYNQFTLPGIHVDETQFGGGGEWYAAPWLTLSVQGGGLAGKGSGGYIGGEAKGYVMPDLSLAGLVNYTSISVNSASVHETDYGARAEWLVTEEFPVSVVGSYEHANITAMGFSGATDIWTIGLKLNLNASGPVPLVEHNRTGTLDTIGTPLEFHF